MHIQYIRRMCFLSLFLFKVHLLHTCSTTRFKYDALDSLIRKPTVELNG